MSTLTDFLLARIADDEATAINWTRFEVRDGIPGSYVIKERVLAECEAKRRIVERFAWLDDGRPYVAHGEGAGWDALLYLASIYADHPDYREEWKL